MYPVLLVEYLLYSCFCQILLQLQIGFYHCIIEKYIQKINTNCPVTPHHRSVVWLPLMHSLSISASQLMLSKVKMAGLLLQPYSVINCQCLEDRFCYGSTESEPCRKSLCVQQWDQRVKRSMTYNNLIFRDTISFSILCFLLFCFLTDLYVFYIIFVKVHFLWCIKGVNNIKGLVYSDYWILCQFISHYVLTSTVAQS